MKIYNKVTPLVFAMLLLSCTIFGQSKPNIVVIFADDLGYGSVGAYGAPASALATPAIDSLAAEGRMFTNAYTPASLCTPSRYSLMTGQYYWRDVREWGIIQTTDTCVIPEDKFNMTSRLKNEGYNTAGFGKWHLGYNSFTTTYDIPDHVGFDKWHDYRVGPDGNRLSTTDTRIMEYLNDETSEWIDAQSSEVPFFLYFAPIGIHTPIIPGEEYQGKSGGGPYTDYIMELDGSVENILTALERNDLADNTIVIFTSDNGGAINQARDAAAVGLEANGGFRGTKLGIHNAGFRVPLIVKWPEKVPKGTSSNEVVNIVDLYTTIMDLLDIDMEHPEDEAEDSYSFYTSWFNDLSEPIRDNMILHSYEGIRAVYADGWKYIDGVPREPEPYDFFGPLRQAAEATEQLYYIEEDSNEVNNLLLDSTGRASELKALLEEIVNKGYSRPVSTVSAPYFEHGATVIKVYPNPASEVVIFEVGDFEDSYDIIITDLLGKHVEAIRNCKTNTVAFHREELKPGFYLYQIVSGNKPIYSGKIQLE